MGALLPTEHQEEFHRQSSAATTLKKKSTLPKQGRDDLEVFFKQTSFLVLMLKKRAKSSRPLLGAVLSLWPGPQVPKCISRESSPGHIDGNDVFCH